MSLFSDLFNEARIATQSVADYVTGTGLRLGVTGLSRSGKTVFITALVHHLLRLSAETRAQRSFPVFRVHAEGRLTRAFLDPQPDDAVPRFAYEDHFADLTGGADGPDLRKWPQSTRRISELRIVIEFERATGWRKGPASLALDIVDYPGEWLLDLPLLAKDYAQWSRETIDASTSATRAHLAADWRGFLATLDPSGPASEEQARRAAELFTAYLRACRDDALALSTLPPGRFLLPGEMEGSPALTFAPLPLSEGAGIASGSLAAMMERRYEAYKSHVVRPFFRDHFARLDRQIVLVDTLSALNSGPSAVRDLETAMTDVMTAFRTGRSSLISTIFRPRIDRILFAATKADHLHHSNHDRLEAILKLLVERAIHRAEGVGAGVDVIALAAVRATREASIRQNGTSLEAIIGVPLAGEKVDGEIFDGKAEAAIFPGELPADPKRVFRGDGLALPEGENDWRFVRFRPPIAGQIDGRPAPLPHIRMDRALEFLLGDRLL
ncbi:YcjX family protein [Methylocella sp. CPCC 101449]|uniref:YcjX family protein n=1 Tax=Methylocella sp. CPCC 101449 TaxID=2987531 RepID=UPI00288D8FBF|nr:YcjX family protein [Methylocella sp. CPCC 101449]MDT2021059.1 YcjX family protein [Methylocella sp. CPCC 101449]